MVMHKNVLWFFVLYFVFVLFSVETNYEGSFKLHISSQANFATDYSLTTSADISPSTNSKIFLPKDTLSSTKLKGEVYMCPGQLDASIYSSGLFHKSTFFLNGYYYAPSDTFACDCYTNINYCQQFSCSWPSDDEISPPYGVTFISPNLGSSLQTHFQNTDHKINRNNNQPLYSQLTASQSIFLPKHEDGNFYPFIGDVVYPKHKTYATFFFNGIQAIFQNSQAAQISYPYPFVENSVSISDTNSQKFSTKLSFTNNKQDSFFKGVDYKGQIYTISANAKVDQYLPAYYPLPTDRDFSAIYLLDVPPNLPNTQRDITFNEKSSEKLTVYVVEPNDCSEIDILDVSPNPLQNLEINKPVTITLFLSTPYELFGMKATNVKLTSPNKWKITKVSGFDTSFSFSNSHELKFNITPTTIIAKKSKVCFEIEFETDTEFCDGKICSTKKEVCIDYSPVFYCKLEANPTTSLKSGDFANIYANCYLDNNPTTCPSLTWTASGFNKPPSKIERISLTYLGASKPHSFSPPGNPKVLKTNNPPFQLPGYRQGVILFTYSDQEASSYGLLTGTPSTSTGKIVAEGETADGEQFKCSILFNVASSDLPDLVPVIHQTATFSQNSILPTFTIKWGVQNQKQAVIKPKQDSPLGSTTEQLIGGDINTPFNVSLYFLPPNPNPPEHPTKIKEVTIPSLKAGETYWVSQTFSYQCSFPILTYVTVIADEQNKVKERNENNNQLTSYLNCLYKLSCPDFI